MKTKLTTMTAKSWRKYAMMAAFAAFTFGCQTDDSLEDLELQNFDSSPTFNKMVSTPIEGQFIVTLKKGTFSNMSGKGIANYNRAKASFKREALNLFKKAELKEDQITDTYGFAINGFTAKLDKKQIEVLKKDPNVISVEQDLYVVQSFAITQARKPGGNGNGGGGGGSTTQSTPYGIARVAGGQTYTGSKTAWIIDSGIDLNHPDLNVDAARSVSYDTRDSNPDDDHGHGTHVAGTVAAIDNSQGVVGVAAGTTVVAVRVVNRRGGGSTSWCVSGVDYVAANAASGDVANMSLGYPATVAIDNAVLNAASQGIKFALAAGNDGANAGTGPSPSPARVNGSNIFTVSAMNSSDNFASFSNYGNPPVDYCAPGVSVLSCWKGGGYNTISGTSMASPHVAGLLIWGNISTSGTVNNDPDGNADPIASR
jgi:subtilisin family serine protease